MVKGITWTTSGPKAAGPKKTKGEEDSSFLWTLSGITKAAQKGSITAKYDKWTLSAEYELLAAEEEPPPPPREDPPAEGGE